MPKLTIVIGANGAGKSTWCNQHRARRLPAHFYNADSIAQGLGDWNSPSKQRAAREVVDGNIEKHLTEKNDFGFESTYSGKSRPDIVRRAKKVSYTIEAIFVGTTRPEINVKRVEKRVAARTGHDVQKREIHRRWKAAQDNLAATAEHIDRIELLDNSGRTRRSSVRIENGRIAGRASRVPEWARRLAARTTGRGIEGRQEEDTREEARQPPGGQKPIRKGGYREAEATAKQTRPGSNAKSTRSRTPSNKFPGRGQ